MATNYFGTRFTASPFITGAGLLHGLLVSHDQATVQKVQLFDNTTATGTVLITAYISTSQTPYLLLFPRRYAIPFTTGLSVLNGNCEVNLWATAL